MTGITTGWETLDQETSGYQNADLIAWVARPGLGKTHLLIHQAKSAWMAGKSILFVSMEMSLLQITNRFIGHYACINPEYIRRGQISTYLKHRFDDAVIQLGNDRRFHLFAGNMGKKTDDIDILVQELNPDIIYIDGMYLMKPGASGKSSRSRYDSIAYVLDDIKQMTIQRDRPIVTTTQFNRGAGKGGVEGSLETIGYTDAIATHASIVATILPPHPKRCKAYGSRRFREISILKGREGESRGFNIAYNFAPMEFFELRNPPDEHESSTGRNVQEETNEGDGDTPGHIIRTTRQRGRDRGWEDGR
jgi:hypothetical protein